MGLKRRKITPFAIIISIAIFIFMPIFLIFSKQVNGQFLSAGKHYANIESKINHVRFGKHSDKTRMVIDLKIPTDLVYKISNDRRAIQFNLPRATWNTTKMSQIQKSISANLKFIRGSTPRGSLITITSDTPISIKRPFLLSPQGNYGHRLVIDIVPATITKNNKTGKSLVASLDNLGAIAPPYTEVAQTYPRTRSQNPYIQRAFPQHNAKPKRIKPNSLLPQKSQRVHSPGQGQRNLGTKPINNQPYVSNNQGKEMGMLGLNNSYIRGSVGMQLLDEISNDGNGVYDQEWDPGFILSSAIGTKLEDGFRVEGELIYANSSLKQVSGIWNGSDYNTERVQGDISSTALMGNIFYDFSSNSRLIPYGMAGIGMTLLSLNDLKAGNSAMANDMDVVAALQLGTGVTFDLDRRTKIELGYRYFETQNPEFSDSTGTPYESVFASHKFLLGTRVELN